MTFQVKKFENFIDITNSLIKQFSIVTSSELIGGWHIKRPQ